MTGQRQRVRIASYNTRRFQDDRAAAARVVRRIDPDILCLQEAPRRPFAPTMVRRFARDCELVSYPGHRTGGGTTILTHERIGPVEVSHHRLTVAILAGSRGYALARLTLPAGRSLVVASVHLSLHAGERHAHTRTILDAVGRAAGGDGGSVVAGDLNEFDTGTSWRRINGLMPLVSPRVPTFPTKRPRALLDVIFASADLTVLPHTDIDLDEDDVRAASDHRPVWVDLLG